MKNLLIADRLASETCRIHMRTGGKVECGRLPGFPLQIIR
jgi:hypothetical protein